MKVKEHLAKFHESASEHHEAMAEHHAAISKAHAGVDDDLHKCLSDSHGALAKAHSARADYHSDCLAECSKADETVDLTKDQSSALDQVVLELQKVREEFANTMRPDSISSITRTNAPEAAYGGAVGCHLFHSDSHRAPAIDHARTRFPNSSATAT